MLKMKYDLRAFQTPLKKPYEIKKAPKEGEEIIFVFLSLLWKFWILFLDF